MAKKFIILKMRGFFCMFELKSKDVSVKRIIVDMLVTMKFLVV